MTTNPDAVAQKEYLTGLEQRIWLPGASVDAGFTGRGKVPAAHGATTLITAGKFPVGRILAKTKFDDKT